MERRQAEKLFSRHINIPEVRDKVVGIAHDSEYTGVAKF